MSSTNHCGIKYSAWPDCSTKIGSTSETSIFPDIVRLGLGTHGTWKKLWMTFTEKAALPENPAEVDPQSLRHFLRDTALQFRNELFVSRFAVALLKAGVDIVKGVVIPDSESRFDVDKFIEDKQLEKDLAADLKGLPDHEQQYIAYLCKNTTVGDHCSSASVHVLQQVSAAQARVNKGKGKGAPKLWKGKSRGKGFQVRKPESQVVSHAHDAGFPIYESMSTRASSPDSCGASVSSEDEDEDVQLQPQWRRKGAPY